MTVTVDRSNKRESELRLSGFWVQHLCEYSGADAAGVQRGIDYMNSVYDNGWVATHGSSPSFRQRDAMEVEGTYQWGTSGNMRGLFDPATGNQAVVPAMARVNKAKRLLVSFGVPKPYSSNPTSASYDFAPCKTDSYAKLGAFWVRVLDEAVARGTPFHGVSHRQELKGQQNRNFGSGGGGQSEVDSYNAIRYAVKSKYPNMPMLGPHLAVGGTRTIIDRQRPLKWAWDKDFLTGWMQRVDGWDGVLLDWASIDMNASGAAEGVGNPDLVATWVPNWQQLCNDFWELGAPYFGPNKIQRLGFIEHYSLDVNLTRWSMYPADQQAGFQIAVLMQLALGGCAEVFDWQPEGSATGTSFENYFGLFNKTATSPASPDTGKPTLKGMAVKWFHDQVPPGANIYPVTTGNQRVFGLALDDSVLLVNLNSTSWTDTLGSLQVSIAPYAYTKVPFVVKPPDPVSNTVLMMQEDIDAIRSDQNSIVAAKGSSTNVKNWAKHTLSLLPK